jgi:hypothetical protein
MFDRLIVFVVIMRYAVKFNCCVELVSYVHYMLRKQCLCTP